jgi:high-affinity Fe2+/Pb2+ permease
LPAFGDAVWDTLWLPGERGIVGKTLHTLTGYIERPSSIQIVAYLATLACALMFDVDSRGRAVPSPPDASEAAGMATHLAQSRL